MLINYCCCSSFTTLSFDTFRNFKKFLQAKLKYDVFACSELTLSVAMVKLVDYKAMILKNEYSLVVITSVFRNQKKFLNKSSFNIKSTDDETHFNVCCARIGSHLLMRNCQQ